MSSDRILRQRLTGPYLHKERKKKEMSLKDAQDELDMVEYWLSHIEEHQRNIKNINIVLGVKVAEYNCTNLNHLISVLRNKAGKVKDVSQS